MFKAGIIFFALWAASSHGAQTKILFLGDSLTDGYGVKRELAFPFVIETMLEKDFPGRTIVQKAGVSGSTTASLKQRVPWHLKSKPDIVVLGLGGNDALRGLPPETMEQNLERAITEFKNARAVVLLLGMRAPPNLGAVYTQKFNSVFVRLAKKHALPFVPFILESVAGKPALNQADGIHPTAEGQRKIAETIYPVLKETLNDK